MAYAERRDSSGKGKKPTWRVKYRRPDGSEGSESGFETKSAALSRGRDLEASIRAGTYVDPKKAKTPFRVWVPIWMAAQAVDKNTVAQRRRDLNTLLLPGFGDEPLSAINLFTAKAWANKQTHARSRVDKALTLLSMILTGAADAGYILANPLSGRRRHTGRGRKEVKEEQVWAQPEHVPRIAERMTPANGLMVIAEAWLGCRWGELAGLHRDNCLLKRIETVDGEEFIRHVIRIDPEVGTLHEVEVELTEAQLAEWRVREAERLAKAAERGRAARTRKEPRTTVEVYLGRPKNETSSREVDVPPFLAELLRRHLEEWTHPYVFVGPLGGWHRRGNFGVRHLRPAADGRPPTPRGRGTAGVPGWEPILPGLTMRGLRHTHDTWMKEDRVDRALRFQTMGWATADIEGVYEHVTPAMRKVRLDALQARWVRARRGTRWDPLRKIIKG